MSTENDLCDELITVLNTHLSENSTVDALSVINCVKYEKCIKDKSWDLIPAISKYLVQETLDNSPDTFYCCKSLLEKIAHKANPEEALLEFLEQAECVENDLKFLSLLKPLEIILFRLPKRRGQSLEWCLNVIQIHAASLPLPENYRLEGSERKLMDSEPSVIRITDVYKGIVHFYKPFINDLSSRSGLSVSDSKLHMQKDILVCYIFQLLGRPLAALDLHYDDKSCSSIVCVVEELISFLMDLVNDPMIFLEYTELRELEERSKHRQTECVKGIENQNNDEDSRDIFTREEKLPVLSIAIFYYLILVEKICQHRIPRIYSPLYIYQRCVFLIVILLENSEELMIQKGLLLARDLLSRLNDGSINYLLLDSPANGEFVKSLTKVMIYCEVEEMRRCAVLVLRSYLHKFDIKGQYLLMSNLPVVINHSGILGYLITQLKEMIIKTFDDISSFFSGKYLYGLITKYCSLKHGPETDLVENADQIVSALNLIRFLILRDKDNKTGIWDHMAALQISFLNSLREAINLSRAHYKLKLKDLEEENKISTGFRFFPRNIVSFDKAQENTSSSSEENSSNNEQDENIKNKILAAALPFVCEHGWTKNAISKGAQSLGYPGTIHGLFPQGGAELVQYFYVTCNQELGQMLKKESQDKAADASKRKQPEVFIQDAVQLRLSMIIPYINKWPQALAIMSLPPNVPSALANLLTLVDDICYYAGDRSVDFTWYSRRIALAGIYKMTELYMIQDKSTDFQDTWNFLGRRIEDVSQLQNCVHQTGEVSQVAKEAVTAAFITARNILGLNLTNR